MSSLDFQKTLLNENNFSENENELFAHKYNLFQQFFVVGFDPKIMFNINKMDLKSLPNELLVPKIISKYPNQNLPYINIPDSIVASHCFPKGLLKKIIPYDNKDLKDKIQITEDWIFFLDNLSTEDKYSSLKTNKVYYTCYLFYENVENYKNLANYRRSMSCKSEAIYEEDTNKKLLIPKVICISSFTPLYKQGRFLLHSIKKYVDNYNFEVLFDKNNFYPIEKIIEGIIFNLPGLPRGNFVIKLDKQTFYTENNEENDDKTYRSFMSDVNEKLNSEKKIVFGESPANKRPRALINYSLLLKFFRIDEIFDIIKYILYEEPILFFCENIQNLTHTIVGVLALIYPLEYPYPVVTVLPEENYSLISVFNHFIFGINCQFSDDLIKKKIINIDGKKSITIVRIENRFNNPLNSSEKDKLKIQVISCIRANANKPLIKLDQLKNGIEKNLTCNKRIEEKKNELKLPIHYTEKVSKRIEPFISTKLKEASSKKKQVVIEKDRIVNNEFIDNFLYYFSCILINYQEFCVKFDKIKKTLVLNDSSSDSNLYMESLSEEDYNNYIFERKKELEEKYVNNKLKIKDMFNCDGFIASTPPLDRRFYERFAKTKIFYNFIKKKIFPHSIQDKLDILYFDDKINEKLARESKMKKIGIKFIEDDLRNLTGEIIIGSLKKKISNELKKYLSDKRNCEKGLNYFQYIIKHIDDKKEKKRTTRQYENDDNIGRESNLSDNRVSTKSNNDIEEIKDNYKFYYYVFPKLLNDDIFFKEKKDEDNNVIDAKSNIRFTVCNSNCLYNQFEKEGLKIVNNISMTNNYKNYSYSLNPFISYKKSYFDFINELWLQFLAKTFYYIPFSQKMNYFDQIMQLLKNYRGVDDNTLIMLFNTIYKYGDRNMNQEFFVNLRNKTYTSFLFLREKTKPKNNFIDFRLDSGNNMNYNRTMSHHKDKTNHGKLNFIINSYCTKMNENEKENKEKKEGEDINICNEPFIEELNLMFNEQENFIQFECNKCLKRQKIIISCFYEKNNDFKYHINFRLVSPSAILRQKWFKESNEIDISYIRREYMESYLSTLFYFNQQGLIFDFLLPKTAPESQLFIERISYNNNLNEQPNTNLEPIIIESVEEKEEQKGEEKKGENKKGHQHVNSELDLGDQSVGFFEQVDTEKKDLTSKTHSLKKHNSMKKKAANTVTCAEFQLNIEEKK